MKIIGFKHLIFWIVYLSFDTYTEYFWMYGNNAQVNKIEIFTISFISVVVLLLFVKIPLVYCAFYLIKKNSDNQLNKIIFVLCFIGNIVFFNLVMQLLYFKVLIPLLYKNLKVLPFFNNQFIITSLFDEILILGIAIAIKQYSVSEKLRKRQQILEKEKLETELNFLKAQINPHFLFNTLNNIYSLSLKKSDEAPIVVLKLSKLLRFVLYETQNKTITIAKEIQFLNDYIELEKIRYNNRLTINFEYQADDMNALIAPLILVPFVENAFKHGASETIATGFIQINLHLKENELSFAVKNSFENDIDKGSNDGIGLKNLRRQLELLYPNFDLYTSIEKSVFKATLLLNLNKK